MKSKTELNTIIKFLDETKRTSNVKLINLRTHAVVEITDKPKVRPSTTAMPGKREAALRRWEEIRAGTMPAPKRQMSAEGRAKLSLVHKGKEISAETRARMSATKQATRAAKESQVTCPHCGLMGWNSPNTSFNKAHAYMAEHHFENCMDKPKH